MLIAPIGEPSELDLKKFSDAPGSLHADDLGARDDLGRASWVTSGVGLLRRWNGDHGPG